MQTHWKWREVLTSIKVWHWKLAKYIEQVLLRVMRLLRKTFSSVRLESLLMTLIKFLKNRCTISQQILVHVFFQDNFVGLLGYSFHGLEIVWWLTNQRLSQSHSKAGSLSFYSSMMRAKFLPLYKMHFSWFTTFSWSS